MLRKLFIVRQNFFEEIKKKKSDYSYLGSMTKCNIYPEDTWVTLSTMQSSAQVPLCVHGSLSNRGSLAILVKGKRKKEQVLKYENLIMHKTSRNLKVSISYLESLHTLLLPLQNQQGPNYDPYCSGKQTIGTIQLALNQITQNKWYYSFKTSFRENHISCTTIYDVLAQKHM